MSNEHGDKFGILVIGSLGVVFGDLSIGPLYTLRVCISSFFIISPTPKNILGLASLIFWALPLVVRTNYAIFILRSDDEGEGGIFAMLALLHENMGAKPSRNIILVMSFGSALLYGDGLITPGTSVLSDNGILNNAFRG
jgi:KUP system potassium uptake protein